MHASSFSLDQAIWLHKHGQLDAAAEECAGVLRRQPRNFDALYFLGCIKRDQGKLAEAAEFFRKATISRPKSFEAHFNLGGILSSLGQYQAAITSLQKALKLRSDSAEAHFALGYVLVSAERYREAVGHFRSVTRLRPDSAEAYHNLGIAYAVQKHYEEAVESFRRASALNPDNADAQYELGNALANLQRYDHAIESYERALALRPDYADAHNSLGNVLAELDRCSEAIESFRKALAIKPDHADALNNLGNAFTSLKLYGAALSCYEKAVACRPDLANAVAMYALTKRYLCDWQDIEAIESRLIEVARSGLVPVAPFPMLAVIDDPALQLSCASRYWRSRKIASAAISETRTVRKGKIRLGYLSSDFHEHATAYLMANLFERHDRERFEVFAFSYGIDDKSEMRRRLEKTFDGFYDVRAFGDRDIVQLIRQQGIDILVDLKGHTTGGRLEILASRPAPVQVHYLGYPGTLGVDFVDYMIVDAFLVPPEQQKHFTERLVYLPDSYQVNDPKREIDDLIPSRAQCGLPEEGFVFCCFNNNYKITPVVFDVWMRLLAGTPESVLWLLADTQEAEANLRAEAATRGIEGRRLFFAPRQPLSQHLARHRLADLFLDTLPYNAHTTASDALWAGLPVLTCAGQSFVARVAGSLLRAVGLPELITGSLAEYEALGLALARDSERLQAIRRRLKEGRATAPLFNCDRTRRCIESAFLGMWEIHGRGEAPRSFAVQGS